MSNTNQPSDAELAERLAALDATPGPWTVVRYGDGNSLVIHDARGDWRVCFMATPGDSDTMEDIEANAELICLLRNYLPQIIAALSRPTASQGDEEAELCEYLRWYARDVAERARSDQPHEKFLKAADLIARLTTTASQPAPDVVERVAEAMNAWTEGVPDIRGDYWVKSGGKRIQSFKEFDDAYVYAKRLNAQAAIAALSALPPADERAS